MCLTLGHRFLNFFHNLLICSLQRGLLVSVVCRQQIEDSQLEGEGQAQGQHNL